MSLRRRAVFTARSALVAMVTTLGCTSPAGAHRVVQRPVLPGGALRTAAAQPAVVAPGEIVVRFATGADPSARADARAAAGSPFGGRSCSRARRSCAR